jgi:hypothetical protein
MKRQYDFSKGERGKFYRQDVQLNFPIYLDPEVAKFLNMIASKKNLDVQRIVNDWLKRDIGIVKAAQ